MPERLQKLIATAGIASRRHAEELITQGRVAVNGKVIDELGAKADPETDHIKVNGRLRRGVRLDDGHRTAPAEIRKREQTATNAWFEVTLREGRNQQIRRMFDAIGNSVLKLSRIQIGSLSDPRLKPGDWRHLTARGNQQAVSST